MPANGECIFAGMARSYMVIIKIHLSGKNNAWPWSL